MVLAGSAWAGESIRIGVAGPFSGAYAAFGEQFWQGARQAVQDLNATGGVLGKSIELVKADDACEPKQAVAVANRLVESDGVEAVIGHFCSSSTIPASAVYDEAAIFTITPASTNPQVTDRNLKAMFRVCGRDDQQGAVAARFIAEQLKAKRVAVVHDKTTYGQGLADAMRAVLNQAGVKEVLYEGITQGEKDFNALVTKIKSVNAEAVYFGGLHGEAGPLVRQLREQGSSAAFISGDGIVSQDLVTAAGGPQFTNGVYMTFGADPRNLKAGQGLVERFRQQGYEPEGYTLYAYAAVEIVSAAITAAGGTDADKMATWLKANPVQTVMGSKSWDAKGDLKLSDYVMYQWNDQGKYAELK